MADSCRHPQTDHQIGAALLQEIAHCPVIADWFANPDRRTANPCRGIIAYQTAAALPEYQLPEPWRGDLEHAPLLFVSSNPSIGPTRPDQYPRWDWPNEAIAAHFVNSFGKAIVDGAYINRGDGRRGRYVAFLGGVLSLARELLEPNVRPGIDYALTEVVHCKSRQEIGVNGPNGALIPCTRRYLRRVLSVSGACVVVVLGRAARLGVVEELTELGLPQGIMPEVGSIWGPIEVEGQARTVAFLPHPNAHQHRSFAKCMAPADLKTLKARLG